MTDDRNSVSWSEIKTYQRCPKSHEYKYEERLVPRVKSRPLFMGNWVHAALESHYVQGDWTIGHQEYVKQWNQLFEEERNELRSRRGRIVLKPFPEIVERIMKSYLWYYRDEGWEVHAVEQKFEVETPLVIGGVKQTFKGIIDLIVKDQEGLLWVVDHKTAGNIPEPTSFHAMDPQLMLYPWAAKQAWGLNVAGIYYNYVKSKPPTEPQLLKSGGLSRRKIVTDYPTYYRFLKTNGFDPADFRAELAPLRRRSPYLRRYRYPREAVVTKSILLDALTVTKQIRTTGRRTRTITRDCATMCSYHDLCRAELNGLDTTLMRKQAFTLKEDVVEIEDETYLGDWDKED
jgi:hypothetical protein